MEPGSWGTWPFDVVLALIRDTLIKSEEASFFFPFKKKGKCFENIS